MTILAKFLGQTGDKLLLQESDGGDDDDDEEEEQAFKDTASEMVEKPKPHLCNAIHICY